MVPKVFMDLQFAPLPPHVKVHISSDPFVVQSQTGWLGSSSHPVDLNYLPNIQQIIQQSPFRFANR